MGVKLRAFTVQTFSKLMLRDVALHHLQADLEKPVFKMPTMPRPQEMDSWCPRGQGRLRKNEVKARVEGLIYDPKKLPANATSPTYSRPVHR